MSDASLFLVEFSTHDGVSATSRYYSNLGFTTSGSDTPAGRHYAAKLLQPITAARNIFRTGGATQGRADTTEGELILHNGDGALDSIFADCAVDGRAITVRQGVPGAAYPSGFTTVFRGTMYGTPELTTEFVKIKAKGREQELDIPIQSTFYAGDNVLPAGLEGTEELTGKPKPVCYGRVRNIAPICVNTSKLIYQVSDGLVGEILDVRDRGVPMQYGFPMVAADPTNLVTTSCATSDGDSLAVAYRPGNGTFYTSTDLESWTATQTITTGLTFAHVVWADFLDLFIFCGGAELWTSPDGVTWTQQAAATFAGKTLLRLAVGESSVIVVGVSGGAAAIWSSTNATAWTARTTNFSGSVLTTSNCAYGNGRFIVTSGTTSVAEAVTSTDDGATWALITIPYDTGVAFSINADIAYFDGLWLVERNAGLIATSVDGETWALNPGPFGDSSRNVISDFWWEDGVYYAFGQNVLAADKNLYGWSADGVLWKQGDTGIAGASSFQIFQAMSLNGRIGVSVVQVASAGFYVQQASAGTYASAADLADDSLAPAPATFKVFLDANGSYIRLGATPDGLITCDVNEGATAADRTVGQVWGRILDERGGLTSGTDFSASDITTLDSTLDGEVGVWIGPEVRSLSEVLDEVTRPECWWLPDRTGVYRLKQLVAPSGTAAATFTAKSLKNGITRRPTTDPAEGLPVWKVIVYYSRNYTVQTTDIAGGVRMARRADFAREWRSVTAEDVSVLTKHPMAPTLSYYAPNASAADTQDIADRILALRKVRRDRYPITVEATATNNVLDLGNVVSLQHARYSLPAGKKFVLVGVQPNAASRDINLELWGGQ